MIIETRQVKGQPKVTGQTSNGNGEVMGESASQTS